MTTRHSPTAAVRTEPRGDVTTSEESTRQADDGELPLDVLYSLLSNERRRRTLRFLSEEPETTLGELAEHIAAIENGKPVDAVNSTERKRVYICLYQCHLPKLDDAGVIDFDQARKTVRPAGHAEELLRYLPGVGGDGPTDRAGGSSPLDRVAGRLRRRLATLR